jgi:uncharacterized membrane protein
MRWILALFYGLAGVLHLRTPEAFLPIMPDWVPWPYLVVIVTGLCEIAGAAALLSPRLRSAAGVMLALYAAAVFPANLKHAFGHIEVAGLPTSWWYHAPRLALQPVLVWWALFCTGVIDWPLHRDRRRAEPDGAGSSPIAGRVPSGADRDGQPARAGVPKKSPCGPAGRR